MAKAAALRKPTKKLNPLDKEGIAYIDYKDTALLRKASPTAARTALEVQLGDLPAAGDPAEATRTSHLCPRRKPTRRVALRRPDRSFTRTRVRKRPPSTSVHTP
jgi:hypothetical protein